MTVTPPDASSEDSQNTARIEMHGESRDSSKFTQIGTQIVRPLPPSELVVRYSLRADTAAFTGRDVEVAVITDAAAIAAASGAVVAIHAIGGMPGVGKTALAVHVAHRLRPRFPDRQLFIDLHAYTPGQRPVLPEAALAGLLAEVGVDARYMPETLEGRAALWRDRMAGRRAVLILDNAASSDQVTPLLPGGEDCLVLITSRRYLGDLPGNVVPVPLDALPPDKAQVMFLRLAARAASAPETSIQEVVWLAGCLPLAISLLARVYARHVSWTLDDLLTETRATLLTLAPEKDSVAAAFDVSYRYLPRSQQDFFRRLGLHVGTAIDAYAAAALAGIPVQEAAEHLETLFGEGLLTEVGYRRYGMHDLLRLYARNLSVGNPADNGDGGLGHLLNYYQYTASVAETRLARQVRTRPASMAPAPPGAVPDLPDRAHALSWSRTERSNLLACLDHVSSARQDTRVVGFTAAIAALLRQDGPWTDAVVRHSTAAQAARRLGDRQSQANALSDLGIAQYLTGDHVGGTQVLEEALGIYRELGDQLGQANVLDDLGVGRYLADDCPGAAQLLGEALGIYRELGDQLGQADVLTHLSAVRHLTGDYRGATELLEEALGIFQGLGDRLGRANALNFLGDVRRQTGDYRGATEVLEEALGIFQDLGNRQGQANALNYLADVRRQTGDYQGATEAIRAALDTYRDLGHRLGQATSLRNLGIVRRLTGDYRGAAEALGAALAIYRDLGDRGGEAEALNEVGTLHRVRNDLGPAREYHQRALDLAREADSSWDEACALAGLGRCAQAVGDIIQAKASLLQAHEIFQRIGAVEAPGVAEELHALSDGEPST
jgi:tetratricopeptide (TPR) repeat protein